MAPSSPRKDRSLSWRRCVRPAILLGAALALALGFGPAPVSATPSRVAATGMAATPAADTPLVRLQLASFRSRANADRFAAANQIGWNDCVLGKRLGVLPPGRDSLPERCTARVDVEVLVVEPARVHGRTFYRVMTRRFPASDLWGPVNAFRLAGIDPLVVK